ncbi:hypothetical protein HN011_009205 [Eciton burchellii]|nr:hypothetical protein HN011_009205 [Eciton burchellii]
MENSLRILLLCSLQQRAENKYSRTTEKHLRRDISRNACSRIRCIRNNAVQTRLESADKKRCSNQANSFRLALPSMKRAFFEDLSETSRDINVINSSHEDNSRAVKLLQASFLSPLFLFRA